MALETFANQESQSSVRQKLNATIDTVNGLMEDVASLDNALEGVTENVEAIETSLGAVTVNLNTLSNTVSDLAEAVDDLAENGGGSGGSGFEIVPIEINSTGNWVVTASFFSTAPGVFSIFPDNIVIEADGAWLRDIDIDEDNKDGGLLTLEFANLTGVLADIDIYDFDELEELHFPELAIVGEQTSFSDLQSLTQLSLPKLEAVVEYFQFYRLNALEEIDLPLLKYTEYLSVDTNGSLTSLSAESLLRARYIYVSNNYSLTVVDFPSIISIDDGIEISGNSSLTSVNLPDLEVVGSMNLGNNLSSLVNFEYGNSLKQIKQDQNFGGCALNHASVSSIISTTASLDGTGGTTEFTNMLKLDGDNAPVTLANVPDMQILWDRSVSLFVNYQEQFSFIMTAGTSSGSVGFIKNITGSIDNSLVQPYLTRLSSDGTNFIFTFEGPQVLNDFILNRSFFINDIQINGSFNDNEGTITFELYPEEPIPAFVNGQTYTINIGN